MRSKQVIVMRVKYPDGKGGQRTVRKGKMIAQGSHASMLFLVHRVKPIIPIPSGELEFFSPEIRGDLFVSENIHLYTEPMKDWLMNKITKICLAVDTEEELDEIYELAKSNGLEVNMVVDAGDTEFGGVPTKTCLAIGPNWEEDIDPVTGHLKLY